MSELVQSIRERYLETLDRIASAAKRAGRSPQAVKLVVVTKAQPVEVVRAAIEAGAAILGENYAEEGVMKIQSLRDFSAVEWHMIGHVQSRKAALVAGNFNFMHSLDSLKLARRLDRFAGEAGRKLPVLLEFNVGGEESKSGWNAWDEARWGELLDELAQALALPNLQVRGLMSMPPLGDTAEFSRPFFQKLRRLQGFLAGQFPQADFSELSMGTSVDYETAVEESATFVRVGTAILGARVYKTETE
ncbi:MAG: YggS family pyridoxal phosphate-dependent enzyme [Chloroflexi bacterium]|nr:YggS family pyridoxal phosphate-dependent enzyme [Chloroflexi bacterium CFX2]MCQ3939213.1 YggS family pyridoxal phosphate-dependent enzyme [Chloroflexota bacterium]MDL1943565.1 YggS family pyridoxal phosphate-dependent enzyme [Chloroflexi bacterium CFX2]